MIARPLLEKPHRFTEMVAIGRMAPRCYWCQGYTNDERHYGRWTRPASGNYCDHYATNLDGTFCERCGATRERI